jgi:CubicO group peptidase (beta-lactamase class C family)
VIDPERLIARLDGLIDPYVRAGDFAGVVLIARGDKVLARKAYGLADFETKKPVDTGLAFRIASLSKTFTAAAIEMLIEQGQLNLTDPVSKFVSDVPYGDRITVRHLLLHRSGVGTLSDPALVTSCHTPAELVAHLKKAKPEFEPGTSSQYSNTGYVLLAHIVEKASGSRYADFLRDRVFQSLGLKRTAAVCQDWRGIPHARGHYAGGPGGVTPVPVDEAAWDGAGSIVSTADDLWAWLRALAADRLIRFHALEYPYGWGKRNYSGRPLVEQSGELHGFISHMALYSGEQKLCFVVLSNVESGFFNRIPAAMEAVLFGGDTPLPPVVPERSATRQVLDRFAGTYRSPEIQVPVEIALKDGALWMHWGEDPFWKPLQVTGDQTLFMRAEYATIRLQTDGSGAVTGSIWQWGDGPPLQFKKIASKAS